MDLGGNIPPSLLEYTRLQYENQEEDENGQMEGTAAKA